MMLYLKCGPDPEGVAGVRWFVWPPLEATQLSHDAPSLQALYLLGGEGGVQSSHQHEGCNGTECGSTWGVEVETG